MIKILIVDDSLERVRLIDEAIASSKFASLVVVDYTDTADKARAQLRSFYDLLVLDVLIPKKVGGVPQAIHSITLLSEICSPEGRYVRPGLIVGLTADVAELSVYKDQFLKSASVVFDGTLQNLTWIASLLQQLESLVGSKQKIAKRVSKKVLITIHGIRTYGKWQSDLGREVEAYSDDFEYVDIKYGYFDVASFCIPYFRDRKIKSISKRVSEILDRNSDKDIYIIAHSFGTMIACDAVADSPKAVVKRLLLCGSPLSSSFNLDEVVSSCDVTVNDCGTSDFILVVARMLVLGLGDAGRVGFYRENDKKFSNRYHRGGHSLYFENSGDLAFVEKFWLPLLVSDLSPESVDERTNYLGEDVVDLFIKLMGALKSTIYLGLTVFLLLWIFG